MFFGSVIIMNTYFDEMKNYFTMKKLIFLSLFSATLITISVTACKDSFLDKKPLGVLSPDVLATEKGVDALLIAAYSEVDGWFKRGVALCQSHAE